MKEKKIHDAEPDSAARKQPEADADGSAKPKFEFKILPVNPKNSFDFEDVADK